MGLQATTDCLVSDTSENSHCANSNILHPNVFCLVWSKEKKILSRPLTRWKQRKIFLNDKTTGELCSFLSFFFFFVLQFDLYTSWPWNHLPLNTQPPWDHLSCNVSHALTPIGSGWWPAWHNPSVTQHSQFLGYLFWGQCTWPLCQAKGNSDADHRSAG